MIAELFSMFTPLEVVLMASLSSVVGGMVILAKWFYDYINKINQERSEEIRLSITSQNNLCKVVEKNCYIIEQLPERIHDKIHAAIKG